MVKLDEPPPVHREGEHFTINYRRVSHFVIRGDDGDVLEAFLTYPLSQGTTDV